MELVRGEGERCNKVEETAKGGWPFEQRDQRWWG